MDDERKPPVWAWIIAIFYFGSTLLSLLGFYMILGTHMPVPPASRAMVDSMTTFGWVVVIVAMLCNVAGAVMLLMLRRLAAYLFGAAFAISLLHTAWQLATGDPFVPGTFALAFGFGVGLAVLAYVFRLFDRGVLV